MRLEKGCFMYRWVSTIGFQSPRKSRTKELSSHRKIEGGAIHPGLFGAHGARMLPNIWAEGDIWACERSKLDAALPLLFGFSLCLHNLRLSWPVQVCLILRVLLR